MSTNAIQQEALLTILADVGLAVAAIVFAIKQQPGFDVAAYDSKIESLVADPDLSKTIRAILQATLPLKED